MKICTYDAEENAACPYENTEVSRWTLSSHLTNGAIRGTCEFFCERSGSTYDAATCNCVDENGSMRNLEAPGGEFGRL